MIRGIIFESQKEFDDMIDTVIKNFIYYSREEFGVKIKEFDKARLYFMLKEAINPLTINSMFVITKSTSDILTDFTILFVESEFNLYTQTGEEITDIAAISSSLLIPIMSIETLE